MTDVLLFGGTTEGRQLAHCLKEQGIPTLVCVATEYGESLLQEGGSLRVHPGRLDENAMLALMHREQPKLVLDATHPYAAAVSQTVAAACAAAQVPYHRALRRSAMEDGCMLLRDMEEMIDYLSATEGVVFSSLGSKAAKELCRVRDYQSRLWLRILPTVSSISDCLDAGFPAALFPGAERRHVPRHRREDIDYQGIRRHRRFPGKGGRRPGLRHDRGGAGPAPGFPRPHL